MSKAALDLEIIKLSAKRDTYEQAVPGLFTAGTSCPEHDEGQNGKGQQQTRD